MERRSAIGSQALRRRLAGDDGASVVEFALVLPILALMMLGIAEFGRAWRVNTTVDRAAASGGRSVSTLADNPYADYEALRAVQATLAATPGIEVERVIIYKSDTDDGEAPSDCMAIAATGAGAKGVNDVCNVYSDVQVASEDLAGWTRTGVDGRDCDAGAWDAAWCPFDRYRERETAVTADLVGVYVEVTIDTLSGAFGTEFTIGESAVFMLEPPSLGDI